jgi:outer membrane receptor protein involved in Fe transport
VRKLFTSLILGAGLLGGGSPAWAQTEPQAQPQPEAPAKPTAKPRDEALKAPRELPTVVITASKVPQAPENLTQSVRVISSEDIALRPENQRNLSELLRYEPGIFVSPLSRNDANWGSVGGLGPKYNLNLLDGLPIDSFVDAMSLDPWAFERVEYHRGPASVMYGNFLSGDFAGTQSPLAGVTNFVLRERVDATATRMMLGYGSWNTLNGRLYHQDRAGGLHYLFGVGYEHSDYTNYGTTPSWLNMLKDPLYQKLKVYGKATYFFGDEHKLSLFVHHTSHTGDVGRRNRDFTHGYDTVNAAYANQLTDWLHAQLKVGLRVYDRRWAEDYFGQEVPNPLALREHDGVQQRIIPADLTFTARHPGPGTLTFGADMQHQTYRTYAEPNGQRTTQNDASALSAGLFVEERLELGRFVLRAGGRFSYLQNGYELISGGAPGLADQSWMRFLGGGGVRFKALDELALFANVGTSFTPPAAKSVAGTLLASDAGVFGKNGQLPNPSLKPESGLGVDFGVDLRPHRSLSLGIRGFVNQVTDAIVDNVVSQNPSQTQSINAGSARSLGVELTAEQRLSKLVSWFANFTYTHTSVGSDLDPDQDGAQIPFVPNVTANLGLTLRLPLGFTIAPFLQIVGEFYDSTSKTGRQTFGPFAVANLRAQKTFLTSAGAVAILVELNNLGHHRYALPWQFRDPGFNGMAYLQLTR